MRTCEHPGAGDVSSYRSRCRDSGTSRKRYTFLPRSALPCSRSMVASPSAMTGAMRRSSSLRAAASCANCGSRGARSANIASSRRLRARLTTSCSARAASIIRCLCAPSTRATASIAVHRCPSLSIAVHRCPPAGHQAWGSGVPPPERARSPFWHHGASRSACRWLGYHSCADAGPVDVLAPARGARRRATQQSLSLFCGSGQVRCGRKSGSARLQPGDQRLLMPRSERRSRRGNAYPGVAGVGHRRPPAPRLWA